MTEKEIVERLKQILEPERFAHTIGVAETAVELAKRYNADPEKARIAGLLHDCAKNIDKQEMLKMCSELGIELDETEREELALVHARLGAALAKTEYGIEDEEILDAIRYHTVAKADMRLLTKIVYLADMIEPNREMRGVENLRNLAKKDLDKALLKAVEMSIKHVIKKGRLIHISSIEARNSLIMKLSKK